MTKQLKYADEQEVRAFLWIIDPHAGINRHFDIGNLAHMRPLTPPPDHVLPGQRRAVDVQSIVTEIVVTPWASRETLEEVNRLVARNRYTIPIRSSALARFCAPLPGSSQ